MDVDVDMVEFYPQARTHDLMCLQPALPTELEVVYVSYLLYSYITKSGNGGVGPPGAALVPYSLFSVLPQF